MIRPSRHDYDIDRPSSVNRASGDSRKHSAGSDFDLVEVIAHVIFALLFAAGCMWFFHTFLAAVPALSRVVTGGK